MERAAAAAQDQYKSLLAGLQAVGRVKGWQAQQIVFVGGTCGSVHVESFNNLARALFYGAAQASFKDLFWLTSNARATPPLP